MAWWWWRDVGEGGGGGACTRGCLQNGQRAVRTARSQQPHHGREGVQVVTRRHCQAQKQGQGVRPLGCRVPNNKTIRGAAGFGSGINLQVDSVNHAYTGGRRESGGGGWQRSHAPSDPVPNVWAQKDRSWPSWALWNVLEASDRSDRASSPSRLLAAVRNRAGWDAPRPCSRDKDRDRVAARENSSMSSLSPESSPAAEAAVAAARSL
jgi:hypothetical protein